MFNILGNVTNPANSLDSDTTAKLIEDFCVLVGEEFDGHLVATRLIAHKIQSPLEQEALLALAVSYLTCD